MGQETMVDDDQQGESHETMKDPTPRPLRSARISYAIASD
jgi:hypothetical protein